MKLGELPTMTNSFRMVMHGPARRSVAGAAWGAADEMNR